MNFSKRIFFLTALFAIVFTTFTTEAQAQTREGDAPAMVFNADDMEAWDVARIPSKVRDGEVVLATFKKDRTQIIALVRDGKIVKVGQKPARGKFTSLPQKANPCGPMPICYSFQIPHCFFLPWGGCICICGAWITAG